MVRYSKHSVLLYTIMIIVIVVLTGCSKYETFGTVDMDKLVTIDQLWANPDQYIGKVATIHWRDRYLMAAGSTHPLGKDNIVYPALKFYINKKGINSYEDFESKTDSLLQIAYSHSDSFLPDDHYFQIIFHPNKNYNLIPEWADFKGKRYYLEAHSIKTDELRLRHRLDKWVTGVIVDIVKREQFSGVYSKEVSIIPIGYRVSKEQHPNFSENQ